MGQGPFGPGVFPFHSPVTGRMLLARRGRSPTGLLGDNERVNRGTRHVASTLMSLHQHRMGSVMFRARIASTAATAALAAALLVPVASTAAGTVLADGPTGTTTGQTSGTSTTTDGPHDDMGWQ